MEDRNMRARYAWLRIGVDLRNDTVVQCTVKNPDTDSEHTRIYWSSWYVGWEEDYDGEIKILRLEGFDPGMA